jgi:hypothetical protein
MSRELREVVESLADMIVAFLAGLQKKAERSKLLSTEVALRE